LERFVRSRWQVLQLVADMARLGNLEGEFDCVLASRHTGVKSGKVRYEFGKSFPDSQDILNR
jgi:hypothetical protein